MAFRKSDLVFVIAILTDILIYHGVLSLMCYSCQNQTSIINGCVRVEICSAGKVCMLKMHTDQATGAVYYETGCATKEECFAHPSNNGGPAVMGRKRSILVQDISENQCLLQCCDDDVCNRECLFTTTTSTTVSTTTTPITTTTTETTTTTQSTTAETTTLKKITTTAAPTTSTTMIADTTSTTTTPATTASTVTLTLSTTSPVVTTATTPTTASTTTGTSPVVISHTTALNIPTKPTPGSTASDLPTNPTPPTTINLITPTTKAPTEQTTAEPTRTEPTTREPTTTEPITTEPITTEPRTTEPTTTEPTTTEPTTTEPTTTEPTTTEPTTTILSTPTSSPKINCPPGSRHFGSSCYIFVNREMTIHDAEAYCGQHHGYLVHVDSAEENDFLKRVMTEMAMARGPVQYWIGINDIQTENVWKFNNNQKLATIFDWGPGEPDGKQEFDGHTKADCAVFDPFNNFHWRDEDCSPYQFSDPICELNTN